MTSQRHKYTCNVNDTHTANTLQTCCNTLPHTLANTLHYFTGKGKKERKTRKERKKVTSASPGYPLLVFNKNSTLKAKAGRGHKVNCAHWHAQSVTKQTMSRERKIQCVARDTHNVTRISSHPHRISQNNKHTVSRNTTHAGRTGRCACCALCFLLS